MGSVAEVGTAGGEILSQLCSVLSFNVVLFLSCLVCYRW